MHRQTHTLTHICMYTFKELDKNSLDFGVGKSGGSWELEQVMYGETTDVL